VYLRINHKSLEAMRSLRERKGGASRKFMNALSYTLCLLVALSLETESLRHVRSRLRVLFNHERLLQTVCIEAQSKVKLSISVKISNCSYLETRFSLTKNTQKYTEKVKWKRSTKIIFSKFSCEELNIFCNFKVKYCRPLFPLCRTT
jgi:hypothetical protein